MGDKMYSEKEKDELVDKMVQFLETHDMFEFIELVTAAVATKEMPISGEITFHIKAT